MSFGRASRLIVMTTNGTYPDRVSKPGDPHPESATIVAAVREGDEAAFTAATSRYRRELQVHCYRMLGSFADAEDMVQETFLRAWRRRETFQGKGLRAWLYAIATNGCLDFLEARQQRTLTGDLPEAPPHIPWLQPYPDRLLAPRQEEPEAVMVSRETIELAYLVALQYLPPRQRAVLILSDVLEWSAKEAAELLEMTVASVNSALQRARETLREHRRPAKPGPEPDEETRALLDRYVAATERADVKGLAALLREDVRQSMPPEPFTCAGRDRVVASWVEGGFGTESFGALRCIVTRVNRMPAVACYVRKPGEQQYLPLAVDVLDIEDGAIVEITTFALEGLTESCGLPPAL